MCTRTILYSDVWTSYCYLNSVLFDLVHCLANSGGKGHTPEFEERFDFRLFEKRGLNTAVVIMSVKSYKQDI